MRLVYYEENTGVTPRLSFFFDILRAVIVCYQREK
jgi:hypothetical protein